MDSFCWPDAYRTKRVTVQEAIHHVQPGQRIFIGTSAGEPQYLVKELANQSFRFADLEIVRLMSLETSPLTMIANSSHSDCFTIRSFYSGSAKIRSLDRNKRFITPINLSALPRLFKSRYIPIHVALIQVTPPDDFGWMSLGISVDVTMAAAQSADMVIAQVNHRMPRVLGRSFLHVSDVDLIVEYDEDLISVTQPPQLESAKLIAQRVHNLIDDGSTLQLSLGAAPHAVVQALKDKKDIGIHTRYLTDAIMELVGRGVITNRKKKFNEGKLIASAAIGSRVLYDFLHDNPGLEFYPSDYVNNPEIIARNHKMVSLNVAMAIDLTGQVAADAFPYNNYTGITGMLDFIRGSVASEEGKAILMLASTTLDGKKSRILPRLDDMAVVVPRSDVHYVATEFGVVNLFGKSFQERAMALISIAHPDFREDLFFQAKQMKLLGPERSLTESIFGIYPVKLEETQMIGGQLVLFRPARMVDERLIQEHFYKMEKTDVYDRFLQEKLFFSRKEVASMVQTDYVRQLTIVAVVGEFGFEEVIAIGAYFLEPAKKMAEVAFSVLKEWQGRGLSTAIQKILTKAARSNGISGLIAFTQPQNRGMVRLFHKLPYKIQTSFEDDMLLLICRFDEPDSG